MAGSINGSRHLLGRLWKECSRAPLVGSVGGDKSHAGHRARLDADKTHWVPTKVSIPDHGGFCRSHPGPALQGRVGLVYGCHHYSANIEGSLPSGIRLVRQDLPNPGESFLSILVVRIALHIAVDGIGCFSPAGKPLPLQNVGVLVVSKEDVTRFVDVSCPVLCLAVSTQ